MKVPLAAIVIVSLAVSLTAQIRSTAQATPPPPPTQPAGPNLNSILADIQRVSLSTNGDLSKLRIERWKTDSAEKQQMQQVVNSLQRNISAAIPGLISDAQAAPGSVARTFKLYHNLNVVYEFLNSIAEAAGAFGRKEEYDPLAADAAALDTARQNLSSYIEQVATNMETQARQSQSAAQQAQSSQAPKKVVIDDTPTQQKKKKKKTASTPPPQQQ